MKKALTLFVMIILLLSSSALQTTASSAGDDDNPASSGSSGGGGGGPQFFDYYIPLVFDDTAVHGQSQVVVWLTTPGVVITTFAQNEFGSTIGQYQEPVKLVFNPSDNQGLTNGSLIRTTAPAQVIGERNTEDIYLDQSFAYSILPRRMMGFEYIAPFDGQISLMTLNPGTEVRVRSPEGNTNTATIQQAGDTATLEVTAGSYINSSFPTVGAFYTEDEGMSASMAVPRYLHGSTYYFNGDVTAPTPNEIDRSYVHINPEQPTPLSIFYRNGTITNIDIFGPTSVKLDQQMTAISASRGRIEVNLRIKFSYGTVTRTSTVQLMAIEEMRGGEVFLTPTNYSTQASVGVTGTQYNFTSYDPQSQSLVTNNRFNQTLFERNTVSIISTDEFQMLFATNTMFAFSVSPGKVGHPMDSSVAFINIPLNSQSSQNRTGLDNTWYRFANLAIMRVDIIPGPLEEYTGQLIQIEIKANGTLPASRFSVEVVIDEEVEIEETYDFLQVNESIVYNIRKFLPIGKDSLNIMVDVDTDNEVNELSEGDNFVEFDFNVQNNIRLRFTLYIIVIFLIGFGIYRLRKWLKQRRTVNRAHVDAILTFEEEQ